MNFDSDDPLAGILSDGSDDSFFDDDIVGSKKIKKKSTPVAEKKNALFNLDKTSPEKPTQNIPHDRKKSIFNLNDTETKEEARDKDIGRTNSFKHDTVKGSSPALFRRAPKEPALHPVESIKNVVNTAADILNTPVKGKSKENIEKMDLLEDLDMSSKKNTPKPLQRGKSSQSILDDILGGSSTKVASTLPTKSNTITKSQDFNLNDFLGKTESKPAAIAKNIENKEATTVKKSVQQKQLKPNEDWLGIFQDKDNSDDKEAMPSWLLGSDTKKTKTNEKDKSAKTELHEEKRIKIVTEEIDTKNTKEEPIINSMNNVFNPTVMTNIVHGGNANEDIAVEGTALYMQQQESQLMVALQLKAQEEKLAAIQLRQEGSQRLQRESARANHDQLETLMQRQAERRLQMQAAITAHQDRINDRIKALLGPATLLNSEDNTNNQDDPDVNYDKDITNSRNEKPHSREKKQLLQLVQSLQENHDKEIDLMETSYRRQLAFIEISLSQSEERMKEESEKLVKFYTEKISWLDEHHMSYKQITEDNIKTMTERHNDEVAVLRQQQLDNIRVLQEHHTALMENVKNAVKQENNLIKDSAGFSTNIQELVTDVRENKTQCELLVKTVQNLVDNTQRGAERNFQSKDIQINDMLQHLKKEKESFENEKSESRELIKLLEARLKQMTQFVEEETVSMKQKRMEFEFEKATFNKQTEFAKNLLKRQDEEVKILKEDIQKEYNGKLSRIEEEKAKVQKDTITLTKEKATVQNLKQELEKMKAELQIQLEEASEQHSKLNIEKQHVHMEEHRVNAKNRDLDILAKATIDKQAHADQKYSEAEHVQRKYEERIKIIQEHIVSLNTREKQIAREKVALSRERLNLHNEKRQMQNLQQCSLCKSMQNTFNSEQKYDFPEANYNLPVGVSRDYNGDVMTAMSLIEQEMSHLLGRNLGLKPQAVNVDVKNLNDSMSVEVPNIQTNANMKDYMDPRLMMLRLDVQRVISNIEHNKTDDNDNMDKNV